MSTRSQSGGLVGGVKVDLRRFHEVWMALVYPRQVDADQTVLGKWKPKTTGGRIRYRLWALVGVPVVALLYPFALLGAVIRFNTRRIDAAAGTLGLAGVLVVVGIGWGILAAVARFEFPWQGFLAVTGAATVATVSAGLAYLFGRVGGRATTVVLAYPLAMTALFLPPVVAAFFLPAVGDVVFPNSLGLAIWLLDNVFALVGLASVLRSQFELVGVAYAGMWLGIAVPVGWFTGGVVTLADVVRPD